MSEHQLKKQLLAEHEEAIVQEIEELQKTALMYAAVFGEPGKRTEAQERVWKDHERISFFDRPMLGACPAGHVDPLVLAQNEGKRNFHLHNLRMVQLAYDRKELELHVRNKWKQNQR